MRKMPCGDRVHKDGAEDRCKIWMEIGGANPVCKPASRAVCPGGFAKKCEKCGGEYLDNIMLDCTMIGGEYMWVCKDGCDITPADEPKTLKFRNDSEREFWDKVFFHAFSQNLLQTGAQKRVCVDLAVSRADEALAEYVKRMSKI